jgi:hypothetical protein
LHLGEFVGPTEGLAGGSPGEVGENGSAHIFIRPQQHAEMYVRTAECALEFVNGSPNRHTSFTSDRRHIGPSRPSHHGDAISSSRQLRSATVGEKRFQSDERRRVKGWQLHSTVKVVNQETTLTSRRPWLREALAASFGLTPGRRAKPDDRTHQAPQLRSDGHGASRS